MKNTIWNSELKISNEGSVNSGMKIQRDKLVMN